eukprot:7053473-Lingulodinium_polyedra.AAC.1
MWLIRPSVAAAVRKSRARSMRAPVSGACVECARRAVAAADGRLDRTAAQRFGVVGGVAWAPLGCRLGV